ncbi:GntR family transcriptional regulator [Microbacterium sp. B2969]|uniref:GntR family transcriptional regulator n=1 Tax=Microbacterium alkaliflavum TaxID=3248839 RepID=A0ABW7QE96_9MICO
MSISPVSRRLLSDEVFEQLKSAIVSSELAPGEQVRDADLAARFGLSRTPVREALNRLVDTGLVEAKPGVYTRITPLSRIAVQRTLAVLRVLDGLAVETAVPLMSSRDIQRMRHANDDFASAVGSTDIAAALEADDRFHGVPLDVADNPTLTRVVEQLHPQLHRILHRKFSTLLGGRNTIDHHARLIELCEQRDASAAARLSGDHWVALGDQIDELFDSNQFD